MRLRLLAIVGSAALSVAAGPAAPVAANGVGMPSLKAAFLFTLARFTEWPSGTAGGPLTLCVLGDVAVDAELNRLAGHRRVGGRAIAIARGTEPQQLRACHLLYLAGNRSADHAEILDAVSRLPVLTVGDGEHFVRAGGVAALFMEGSRMRFAINPDALLRAGLRLSSKLLGLAKIVKGGDGQP